MSSRFKAVLFDLGGTIIRNEEPVVIHMRILEANGMHMRLEDVAEAHEVNQREYDTQEMARMGRPFWVKWNMKLLKRLGLSGDLEALATKIDEDWFDYARIEAYPDAVETIRQLRKLGVKTGIVTNGLSRDCQMTLDKVGLRDRFDIAVGVDDCHAAKPDRRIFAYALEKLNICPDEAIFVGDSYEYDYLGAKQAGLKPLFINRNGGNSAEADTITSLTEVLDYFRPT